MSVYACVYVHVSLVVNVDLHIVSSVCDIVRESR